MSPSKQGTPGALKEEKKGALSSREKITTTTYFTSITPVSLTVILWSIVRPATFFSFTHKETKAPRCRNLAKIPHIAREAGSQAQARVILHQALHHTCTLLTPSEGTAPRWCGTGHGVAFFVS